MGGEFTYQPTWDLIGFDPQPSRCVRRSGRQRRGRGATQAPGWVGVVIGAGRRLSKKPEAEDLRETGSGWGIVRGVRAPARPFEVFVYVEYLCSSGLVLAQYWSLPEDR